MKKFFISVILFLGMAFNAFADEGRGSCLVNGSINDYVEVTAYSEGGGTGNFVIANSAAKPLMSVYIVITAEVSNGGNYVLKTLYSKNFTEKVESYQSRNVEFTYPNWRNIRNIKVEVSNPTCK